MEAIITIPGCERHGHGVAESVQVKTLGAHFTETSVVFYDPDNADHWLTIPRAEFDRLHALLQVPGVRSARIHPD